VGCEGAAVATLVSCRLEVQSPREGPVALEVCRLRQRWTFPLSPVGLSDKKVPEEIPEGSWASARRPEYVGHPHSGSDGGHCPRSEFQFVPTRAFRVKDTRNVRHSCLHD